MVEKFPNRGSKIGWILVFLVLVGLIVVGLVVALNDSAQELPLDSSTDIEREPTTVPEAESDEDDEADLAEVEELSDEGEEPTDNTEEALEIEEVELSVDDGLRFSGEVLAGSTSPLLDFNNDDYELAIASDRLVALYFYANWCPLCRAEFPNMEAAFDTLEGYDVVGFRVNYNDNQTDRFERDLAKEFGVAYQHTKVFVKDGARVLKSPEQWGFERYVQEINAYR